MYPSPVPGSGSPAPSCADCGLPSRVSLGGVELCDRCFDCRVAERMGLPVLPDRPAEETLTGPDGRRHRFAYRLWRAPTGIVAEADELGCAGGEGYQASVLGSHHADPDALLARLRLRINERVAHLDLEDRPGRRPLMAGDELEGRLVWNEADGPYDVVVDGRRLSWEEFGRVLEPFEGWRFRLSFEDIERVDDEAASDADDRPPAPRRLH